MNMEPVYLIDGSAYIYRAYHAITPLSNKKGLPTHAVLGFTNILRRIMRDREAKFMAVAFDVKGPVFRHDIFPDYKANRPPMPDDLACQIPWVKKIVQAHNILCLEQQGVEADDLIASAARLLERAGIPVVIVSGDKDFFQLVSDKVSCWEPMNDKIMTPAGVKKKYNVVPSQLNDLFGLMGDKADNIPGVPGVGPKTAEKLINEFGSMADLFSHLDQMKKSKLKEKLIEFQDQALLSKKLIGMKEDLDVPGTRNDYLLPEPDRETLHGIYTELDFTRLMNTEKHPEKMSHQGFRLVRTEEELDHLIDDLQQAEILVLDTETTSLDSLSAGLVGISLCTGPDIAYYIPLGHLQDGTDLCSGQLDLKCVADRLRPFFSRPDLPKLAHNMKYDYEVLKQHDLSLSTTLLDSMIASYLLDPSRRAHNLDGLCLDYLQQRLTTFAEVTGKDKRPDAFAHVAPEEAGEYACEDVRASLLLWQLFEPQLRKLQLWSLFCDVEMKLVPILAKMEENGILVDVEKLRELSIEFADQISELEEKIYDLAGETFNINSPRQLGTIFFDKLGLPHGRKTKTGYSTDIKVLEKLSAYHDLPAEIIAHRTLSKLKYTYVDKLTGQINPVTGRIHTSFNQTVTATGRLSSSNPNLQNIPIRTPEGQRIREAFIPAPGSLFLAADYSQIDLRVLAHYSGDEALLEAFRAGRDIHNQTAGEIFRVNPNLVTKKMRRVAKTINFGIVYGMSAFGLASQLSISRKEAQTFINRYFDHYRGVKQFMVDIVVQAGEDGYVTTLLHRRRLLPDIKSPNKTRREFAERTAINTPIQGTAADIIKLATLKTDELLQKAELNAKLLLQIHDELIFEVPEEEIDKTSSLVKEAMESVLELDVPLVVNLSVGQNLAKT